MRSFTFLTVFACVLLCANAQFFAIQDIKDSVLSKVGEVKDIIDQGTDGDADIDETPTDDDEVFIHQNTSKYICISQMALKNPSQKIYVDSCTQVSLHVGFSHYIYKFIIPDTTTSR